MKLATRVNGVNIYVSDSCVFPAQIAVALGLDVESYISKTRYLQLSGIVYDDNVFFIHLFDSFGESRSMALIPVTKAVEWISYVGAIMMSYYGESPLTDFIVQPESDLDQDSFYEYLNAISHAIESHSSLTRDDLNFIAECARLEEEASL